MNNFDMELTQRKAQEYKKAAKKEKGQIITEYCNLTKVTRNLASKRFQRVARDMNPKVLNVKKPYKKPGRKTKYTSVHKAIVKKIWELSGEICGERLHPIVGLYIDQLEKNDELKFYGKRYITETKSISMATLKRIISEFPKEGKARSIKGNSSIYKAIPIQAYFGRNSGKPGYVEIDYVEHNGGSSKGLFACTGTYVDVCLGWLARSASLGKTKVAVEKIHDRNEKKIFHQVVEYHPDNAKPILKLLLGRVTGKRSTTYTISRSRPYHKEDNGHVEQKNNDKVRKLVGYHRYETPEEVELLNQLYEVEDTISNFFLSSQKLVGKVKDKKGRVLSRKHDTAQTAYQRLLSCSLIDEKTKRKLQMKYEKLNLIELRKESDRLQNRLFEEMVSRN